MADLGRPPWTKNCQDTGLPHDQEATGNYCGDCAAANPLRVQQRVTPSGLPQDPEANTFPMQQLQQEATPAPSTRGSAGTTTSTDPVGGFVSAGLVSTIQRVQAKAKLGRAEGERQSHFAPSRSISNAGYSVYHGKPSQRTAVNTASSRRPAKASAQGNAKACEYHFNVEAHYQLVCISTQGDADIWSYDPPQPITSWDKVEYEDSLNNKVPHPEGRIGWFLKYLLPGPRTGITLDLTPPELIGCFLTTRYTTDNEPIQAPYENLDADTINEITLPFKKTVNNKFKKEVEIFLTILTGKPKPQPKGKGKGRKKAAPVTTVTTVAANQPASPAKSTASTMFETPATTRRYTPTLDAPTLPASRSTSPAKRPASGSLASSPVPFRAKLSTPTEPGPTVALIRAKQDAQDALVMQQELMDKKDDQLDVYAAEIERLKALLAQRESSAMLSIEDQPSQFQPPNDEDLAALQREFEQNERNNRFFDQFLDQQYEDQQPPQTLSTVQKVRRTVEPSDRKTRSKAKREEAELDSETNSQMTLSQTR